MRDLRDVQKPTDHSFASLDFLRGLSAAAVLISHTAASVSSGQSILTFNWGSFAVDVFMLISGFLMMWHFCERSGKGDNWDSPKTCFKFYVRRFFRIAPLYYCMLVVVYVFHGPIQTLAEQNGIALHQPLQPLTYGLHNPTSVELTAAHVLSHFSFTFGFIPCFAASNPLPDWSIGLEMQFYLFFPFLALLLFRSQFLTGAALLLVVNWLSLKYLFGLGIDADPKLLGGFPQATLLPLCIDRFLAGMLLAVGLFESENFTKRTFFLLLGLLVAGIYMKKFLLVCFLFSFYELTVTNGTGLPVLDRLVKRASWFIEHRVFKFMANASYGVYLIHIPLLMVTIRLLIQVFPFEELSPVKRFLLCLVVITPVVYGIAYLAYKYVETPSIAFGRKIVKRIR